MYIFEQNGDTTVFDRTDTKRKLRFFCLQILALSDDKYISDLEEMIASFFLCKELKKGYLDSFSGEYFTPQLYFVSDEDVEAFDKTFPYKEKLKLPRQLF